MILTIPKEFKEAINEMPYNKTVKKNALKIYAALYTMYERRNSFGYFPVPSDYLVSVNKRYSNIINYFIERKLIDFYKKAYTDDNDIFNTVYRKSYNKELGICAKYKFLVDVEVGEEVYVDMISNRSYRWYDIIERSLQETGFPLDITRDTYGRRVWHPAIMNYKTDFKGYWVIDAQCSQPALLYQLLKEKNVIDPAYIAIFENGLDFYVEVANHLGFVGTFDDKREQAKKLFMFWINSSGYVPDFRIHEMFPVVSKWLKSIKKGNYKNGGSLLQRIESKIWIDNLLNNIPCNFALPVHDCLIVKEKDLNKVLSYCKDKYSTIDFDVKKL
jgi:hypothetical protein